MKRLIIYLMITAVVSGCKAATVNRAATLRQLLAVSNTVEAVEASVATNTLALTRHTSDTDNPHQVTLEQLGGLPDETDPVFTAWDKTTGITVKENQITDLKVYATENYVGNAIANIPPVKIPDETDPRAMRLYHYGDPDIEITPESAFGFNPATGTITGYTGTNPDIVLPYEINGVPVVAIGDSAFEWTDVVKTLKAPKTLTTFNYYAFSYSSLTSLVAPALTTLDSYAFVDSSLTSLVAPALTSIGDAVFADSSLTSLVAPALTSIGYAVFADSSLTSLDAPSLTTIDSYAFANSSLTSIYYGGNQPTAGEGIYEGTPTNLVNYVTNPTATGWGATFGGRPVVRLDLHGGAVYSGGQLVATTGHVAQAISAGIGPPIANLVVVSGRVDVVVSDLDAHKEAVNPHGITAEAIGALTLDDLPPPVVIPAETDPVFTAWDKTTGITITENQITDLKEYATETFVGDAIANIPPVVVPDETDPIAMAALKSPSSPWTTNIVASGAQTLKGTWGNQPRLQLSGSTTIDIDWTTYDTSGVNRISLTIVSGEHPVIWSTDNIEFAEVPELSTTGSSTILIRKVGTEKAQGRQL